MLVFVFFKFEIHSRIIAEEAAIKPVSPVGLWHVCTDKGWGTGGMTAVGSGLHIKQKKKNGSIRMLPVLRV